MVRTNFVSLFAFTAGLALVAPVLVGAAPSGCTLGGKPGDNVGGDEGEGEGTSAGEGEGEGEDDTPIDLGAVIPGYTATPPAGSSGHCSTNQWWSFGDSGTEIMHPGGDCMQCHTTRHRGPSADTALTVMGHSHDEDDCRGIPGVTVEWLDATGASIGSLVTNDGGNIIASGLSGQYRVRLTYQGRTTEMQTLQTDGDCMHCHTATGANAAPGRIVAP